MKIPSEFLSVTIRLEPMGGALLSRCCEQAAIIALNEGITVEFVHNDMLYHASTVLIEAAIEGTREKVRHD